MTQPFSSPEKSLVRESCLKLVESLKARTKRPLSYLGLPSPWMGDITAWRPHLGRVFAVEMEELFIPSLVDQAYLLGLIHQLTYFVGDIDDVLQKGKDNHRRDLSSIFPYNGSRISDTGIRVAKV